MPFSSERIEVPLTELLLKKEWLRSSWTSLGRKVDLTTEVKAALIASNEEFALLQELLLGHKEVVDLDLKNLGLKRQLTIHQIQNVNSLATMKHGANFSVPGAGKTATALVVWEAVRGRGEVDKLLIICPRSAFEAWKTEPDATLTRPINVIEFSNDAINPQADLLIVNYEQLENFDKLERVENWVRDNRAMVIVDEAHRVKGGGNSVRWRACHRICANARRVDLLTGTPMPQDYEDLRNLLTLTWQRVPRSYFSDAKLRTFKRGGIFVRTTKNELGLPPVVIEEVEVDAGTIQKQIYSALCRAYVGSLRLETSDAQMVGRKGRAALTLLAVATNPGLLNGLTSEDSYMGLKWPLQELEDSKDLLEVVRSYSSHEMPNKYNWIRHFVEQAAQDNRKVLIWSTFVGNLRALQRVLEPHQPAIVHGSVPFAERQIEIDRFRRSSSCSVLLTNPQTLGEGVSLHQVCHDAIYVDRSYNAGLYLQSLDRIHRLGLKADQETRVYTLSTRQTIDQRVGLRLEQKIGRLGKAMDDAGLVKASIPDFANPVDFREVLDLNDFDASDLYKHLINYA